MEVLKISWSFTSTQFIRDLKIFLKLFKYEALAANFQEKKCYIFFRTVFSSHYNWFLMQIQGMIDDFHIVMLVLTNV